MYKIQKYFEKRVGVCVQLLHELTARKGPGCFTLVLRDGLKTSTSKNNNNGGKQWKQVPEMLTLMDGDSLACACAILDLDVPE